MASHHCRRVHLERFARLTWSSVRIAARFKDHRGTVIVSVIKVLVEMVAVGMYAYCWCVKPASIRVRYIPSRSYISFSYRPHRVRHIPSRSYISFSYRPHRVRYIPSRSYISFSYRPHREPCRTKPKVDGVKTTSIDAFLEQVNVKPNGATVRIKLQNLRGETSVTTLTLDRKYWPTADVRRVDDKWVRTELDARAVSAVDGPASPFVSQE
jgi:hypothetical protein